MITFCGWYTLIFLALSLIITIAKDGESTTEYTGVYKLVKIIIELPIYYFVITSLFY